ncbi:MAG: alternative ribosome rescue aminoacyl-tRNA hydrolase ArfB [Cyclobacteriaceae bacterium]|jgi:ribosome-associated protein|nr:aminoacyl-tRNA hydrolase [Cytophagales bacterium]HNP78290.1 alternative ribosome rescue aminoacyl-tRNA hydrolase ArfB [Cyclobacteriaceae bacterium]HQQ82623.1 alternative ribosome rescue aminoacyl-tRNA hydrolase ArfB [Cyclobacteriaceae bacterium]
MEPIPVPTAQEVRPELEFLTSRSSGAGGQNVNKVNSKVTLQWDVANSARLTPEQKARILDKLQSRLSSTGILTIVSQESRSQLQNRDLVMVKLDELLRKALATVKRRKKTKPTKASSQRRLESKKRASEKKQRRSGWQE